MRKVLQIVQLLALRHAFAIPIVNEIADQHGKCTCHYNCIQLSTLSKVRFIKRLQTFYMNAKDIFTTSDKRRQQGMHIDHTNVLKIKLFTFCYLLRCPLKLDASTVVVRNICATSIFISFSSWPGHEGARLCSQKHSPAPSLPRPTGWPRHYCRLDPGITASQGGDFVAWEEDDSQGNE